MKYKFLYRFLKVLIYIKRFFWWIGSGIYFVLGKIIGGITKTVLYLKLKLVFFLRRIGVIQSGEWVLKRDFLQILFFIALFSLTISQTALASKKDLGFSGQKTLAYALIGADDEAATEEVIAESSVVPDSSYSWKTGAIIHETAPGTIQAPDLAGTVVAGGTAINKPILMPGVDLAGRRTEITDYTVQPGDSLSSIAYDFGISAQTIMWSNNLSERSVIRPGDTLKILPVSGVSHTIKKGDTLKKLATTYGVTADEIIKFNRLEENGSDLKTGETIIIPGGAKPNVQTPVTSIVRRVTQTVSRKAAPPASSALPSISGFVWPTATHIITQYFGIRHHALDLGGPWQTAIYAVKSGVIEKSQCGWNSGYGCYIIIDHGNGVKTLYGHNSQLLVNAGDYVETGQTIALMGNTGNVRGVTGIHSHFEVQVNGVRVNPLKYVR